MALSEELPNPKNADILIHVGGELLPREQAKVSVFDSVVQGGDAVWEGLRVYDGRIYQLNPHLDRLFDSAKAMAFEGVPTREEVRNAVFETLKANGMRDEVHMRLTLTRGIKFTSNMDPRVNTKGCTLIIVPEWKGNRFSADGITLITSAIRRNTPSCLDSKIHHNNLINNILAKIEANVAGADEALMLDLDGFVAETNATNVFLVKKGRLLTPHGHACLPGITRATILRLARDNGVDAVERNVSIAEVYSADEIFTTGTVGELTPVLAVDGRTIGEGEIGPMTERMQGLFRDNIEVDSEPLPF